MHAGTAGGGEADEGHLLFDGSFDAAHKALAHHRAHRAAHEVELKAGGHHVDALDRTTHDDEGVGFARVLQGFFQALGVLAAVLELEGVHGQHFLADFIAAFGVQKGVQPCAGANAVVVAALGADVLVLLQVSLVEHGFAARALDPQPFGYLAALGGVGLLDLGGQEFFEPGHGFLCMNEPVAARP